MFTKICRLLLLLALSCGWEEEQEISLENDVAHLDAEDLPPPLWTDLPIRLFYSEDFNQDFLDAKIDPDKDNPFIHWLKEWDAVLPEIELFDYDAFTSVPKGSFKRGDGISGIYRLTDWSDLDDEARVDSNDIAIMLPGLARRHSDHTEFLEVDILFNYENFEFNMEKLRFVFLHEVGHLLGLMEHEEDFSISSIMHPSIRNFNSFRGRIDISLRDRLVLRQRYLSLLPPIPHLVGPQVP